MHHATVLITLNLVHKQLTCYICHMPQNLEYYKVLQSQRPSDNIRLSRFAWTTYAKLLGKICYNRGTQHRARGSNVTHHKFENGRQAIY